MHFFLFIEAIPGCAGQHVSQRCKFGSVLRSLVLQFTQVLRVSGKRGPCSFTLWCSGRDGHRLTPSSPQLQPPLSQMLDQGFWGVARARERRRPALGLGVGGAAPEMQRWRGSGVKDTKEEFLRVGWEYQPDCHVANVFCVCVLCQGHPVN